MRARVVGAGLSGLASAWCLADAGVEVEVVESTGGPGGLIGTRRTPHGLVERAANAFVWNDRTARWFARLDITPSFTLSTSRRRFIWRRGRPRRWPLSPGESAVMGARLGLAAVRGRMRPADSESVATYVDRVAGRAATQWLVGPALQGVYAAPPDRLDARAVFGHRHGGRTVIAAPPGGMGEFIERLHERLEARGVTFAFGQPIAALDPDTPTVVCTHAPAAAALLHLHAPALARAIASVPMSEMLTVTAFFEPQHSDVEGFGVLFPRDAGVVALGVLFNASVFDGRSHVRSETWIYSTNGGEASLPGQPAHETLLADRGRLTGRTTPPLAVHETCHVPGLPVYSRAILDVEKCLPDLPPWLALTGNYLGERGVANLLMLAERSAQRLVAP